MSSELELLRQRITELEAENTKLRQIIEENSKREAENAEHKNLCFVGEEYISSVTAVSQPDTEPERHLALNDIPDPVIDQCVRIAKQHVADSSDIKSMEERETDAFLEFDNQVKNIMKTNRIGEKKVKGQIYDFIIAQLESKVIGPDNPPKANDYDDLYYDDPMSLSMKKGTNEIKLDDENDENDSEEEMPDESDNDDGYDGYGGYNEYGECDRASWCLNAG
ncbi:hypothetical protein GLOIN_2v1474646 [Rhizophagus irregularis DAOM 181602=DAOM 197198]|uniref:Uncharacterized protein n=1 Tax=Rhizophagus irregularis (strain DAOM 181602 / DAOM 197198 / MUCL 43194) TaxID=747089 RepID=A0A2P4QFN7_RHIID|nr:hypothetical protein GLOIN_2v1474646 [Rhizophagus irregularis DAOM 181602=DAOM 197198]POG76449.1 hypothetical protein GLOIN_2v1474646 [Rhizophagus irregularis DAOM 181602=DAOM 197198]|eukprot:XP_025183315.1 hypothetical protein GLOIN_2v1474646 [Rhizophagus irregularis DAOM 181602=DAOM 197198]